jgi:acetylornithine deacetylase/succinyl-diaminopimelate desuccinylase-like protein
MRMARNQPAIDWKEITEEATDLLCRYIAIDTSNPPGNEESAALFLADILRREGLASQLYQAAPGRANLSARLPGDGSKQPLILLNHTDVVPAEPSFWEEPPFSGTVRDGVIWGRGTLDMKGMAVMELMTFLLLKRHGIPLKRDVVFLALADEEMGSEVGAEWMDRHHPEVMEAEYVINEGGGGSTELLGVRRPIFNCSVSEKGPLWLKLRAQGTPGHGSVPIDDNSLERLVRALYRVQGWQHPITVLPEIELYLRGLHEAGLLPEMPGESTLAQIAASTPMVRAVLTNTVSVTTCSAGYKHNVIPATSEASLDCRLLPGQSAQEFVEELKRVIDDPKVEVEEVYRSDTVTSPVQTELFDIIKQVIGEMMKEALVLPYVAAGFTDSRVFRQRGVVAYGIEPVLLEPSEIASIHGHNERISIENLRLGTEVLFEIARRLCS